jgi:NAD(P)-dependent dehydrogenase (short-subunit alcohol dehydrogenase family)
MKKLVFVTGAGRGIGQATAIKLAQEDYVVSGCARTLAQLEETRKQSGGHVRIASVDVTDQHAQQKWMETEIRETGATPWGLVTAAGIYGPIGPFLENNWEEWTDGIEINLFGTALSVRVFAKILIAKKLHGRIVLLSGGGATQPIPNFSDYCAAKSAVVRFGETVAQEFRAHHITVNSIAPGAVNTKFLDDALKAGPDKAGKAMYEKALKQKESGGTSPDKAANLTSYLMSDKAGTVTGRLLSAVWDPWQTLHEQAEHLNASDIYTLRRIVPEDRPKSAFKPAGTSGLDQGPGAKKS